MATAHPNRMLISSADVHGTEVYELLGGTADVLVSKITSGHRAVGAPAFYRLGPFKRVDNQFGELV